MQYTSLPAVTKPRFFDRPNPAARINSRHRQHDRFVLDKAHEGTFLGWTPQEFHAINHLFHGVSILPVQQPQSRPESPERNLLRAVLADAIRCLKMTATVSADNSTNRDSAKVREQKRALEWMTEEDWDWPFSCVNICSALGVDHCKLRMWAIGFIKQIHNQNYSD